MGATLGKKGKSKGSGKQKNKRGKTPETTDKQSCPVVAASESDGEKEEELQYQDQQAVEQGTLPPESGGPSISVEEIEGDIEPQLMDQDTAAFHMSDAQSDIERQLSNQKKEGELEPHSDSREASKESDLHICEDQVESPRPMSIAVAQTPILSPTPASTSSPLLSLSKLQQTKNPTGPDAGSPTTFRYIPPPHSATTPITRNTSPRLGDTSPTLKDISSASRKTSSSPGDVFTAPKSTSPDLRDMSPAPQQTSPPLEDTSLVSKLPAARHASPTSRGISPASRQAYSPPGGISPASKSVSPVLGDISLAPQQASPPLESVYPVLKGRSSAAKLDFPDSRPCNSLSQILSPVTPKTSPVPKVSSLAHPFLPPVAPVSVPPSVAPTIPGPVPPQYAPTIGSAETMPPYAPYRHPSLPSMFATPHNYIEPAYMASFQAIQDLSLGGGYGPDKGAIPPPENEQDLVHLLQRVQSAIPDINRLMHGFKHTQGKLSSREAELKHTMSQHAQILMHKEYYIEALESQLKKIANESAEKSAKQKRSISELHVELRDLQGKQRELEESLIASKKSNEELLQAKIYLENQVTRLNTSVREAQESHERELDRRREEQVEALASQKQELTELFEEIKNEDEKTAAETLEAREKELLGQQESLKSEHTKERQKMQESRDTLQLEFDSKQVELANTKEELEVKVAEVESARAELGSLRNEMAAKVSELEMKRKELDDAREGYENSLNELRQGHAREMQSLVADHEGVLSEKLAVLNAYDEKEKQWAKEKSELQDQLSQKVEELSISEKEKEKMEEDVTVKERQLQQVSEEMQTTISGLGSESERLRRTLNSLGEATDLKSTKGDSFFVNSFDQLSQLVETLSKEHFSYIPIDPPKDVLSKIPVALPSFLDNTAASRELRCAYVQHIVVKTLTYRIFQPFLFTLGRRYDKADTLFQMLSIDIRRKSVRREAFWRQQTLKAAYTASDAKQSINVVAAVIVDEIIDQVKHFADPERLDSLLLSVRKVVKLAAETWRFARVERELVLAFLPAPDAEDASSDGWHEYGAAKDSEDGGQSGSTARRVILRTFPRIVREAAHEDFANDERRASRCVYSQGTALYADSLVMLARCKELAEKEIYRSDEEIARKG